MSGDVWLVTQRCWDQERSRRPASEDVAQALDAVHRGLPCDAVVVIVRPHVPYHTIAVIFDSYGVLGFFFKLKPHNPSSSY